MTQPLSHPSSSAVPRMFSERQWNLIVAALLLAASLAIGCTNLAHSGPLWPDASQYANAAAMIHDWLLSHQLFHPYKFATASYIQFPAFHLPYHPPVYPGLLALFFLATAVSYKAARIFIALCLWTSAWCFYAAVRRTGIPKPVAFCCSLLLLSFPEIMFWSRDTMSEIPGMALILAATYFFLVWMHTDNRLAYFGSFVLAEAAFLSRYLTAGVLPAWFVWALMAGKHRKLMSRWALIPPGLFLAINTIWVLFTIRYSRYETIYGGTRPNTNYAHVFSPKILIFYATELPAMIGWLSLLLAAVGLVYAIRCRKELIWKSFWLIWILSYLTFVAALGIYQENRYFIYALPAFAGLAAHVSDVYRHRRAVSLAVVMLLGVSARNAARIPRIPSGVVGNEAVGQKLAQLTEPGNVLVSSVEQADLIFRYRGNSPSIKRAFIRGDRSLAFRAPGYTDVPPSFPAKTVDDVLEVVRRGRVRYIVTYRPVDTDHDTRLQETILLDSVMRSQPANFVAVGQFPLHVEYSPPGYDGQVFLWRFTGELPQGPSELPVVIPTAGWTVLREDPN